MSGATPRSAAERGPGPRDTPLDALSEPLDKVLRDMTDWIGLVEQPAYDPAGNTIYDEIVNEFVPRIKAAARAALPAEGTEERVP